MCLNRTFSRDMRLLYGDDYKVVVNYVKYITNEKSYIVDCKLIVSEPELCIETYPVGLNTIIENSWVYLSINHPIYVSSTIELSDN